MAVLSGLEPKAVFAYFEKLCAVPHGSGNTRRISDLCAGFARELGLACRQDEAGNLVIWKDGSPGYEDAAPVILQGHMDMVCAKTEDCPLNMSEQGLELATDGEWVWAEKTSLGGDDCIAIAMILAILADQSLPHPPLEAVFTVDEEVGMEGAMALDCSDLKGRQLLNLDSEEEGIFTASCAGGARADCFLPGRRVPVQDCEVFSLELSGLRGGHSGADIHTGRASANQLMVRVLYSALERFPGLRLADLRGGQFDNVICSQATAAAAVPKKLAGEFPALVQELDGILREEYAGCDGGLRLTCAPATARMAWPAEDTSRLLHVLLSLPQGVQAMSADLPGLVQTSLNFGVMRLATAGAAFSFSVRSSVASQRDMLLQRLRAAVEYAGGTVNVRGIYPGWRYAPQSGMRERLLAAYRELSGKEGVVQAIHAGLECGIFAGKLPGLDAVSFGPDLQGIHSVQERLNVASTERVYRLVREFLKRSR